MLPALACAIALTTLSNGAALADPGAPDPGPPPAPAPAIITDPLLDTVDPSLDTDDPPIKTLEVLFGVSPTQGAPGDAFTVNAKGYNSCRTIYFYWDEQLELGETPVKPDGVSVTFPVPEAEAGTHHVKLSCGGSGPTANFTVIANVKADLTLSSDKGQPGSHVTGTGTGFAACNTPAVSAPQPISLLWDGQPHPASITGTDPLNVSFDVPTDASAKPYTVTVTCGSAEAEAPFEVVPAEQATLTLDKSEGLRGSDLTASGSGFACDGDQVRLLWDDGSPLKDNLPGTFSVQLTVPQDVSDGGHTVVASCLDNPEITASHAFTVLKEAIPTVGNVSLSLTPSSGRPEDTVRVAGEGFACDSQSVELFWDGRQFNNPSTNASGHFDTSISVPAAADGGDHTVRASCSDGSATESAGFRVEIPGQTPTVTPTTTPGGSGGQVQDDGTTGWVWVLIVAALIAAGLAYRHWRKTRPRKAVSIEAFSRPGGPPITTIRETPARGEATHAVGIKTRPDIGTVTIREVDDD